MKPHGGDPTGPRPRGVRRRIYGAPGPPPDPNNRIGPGSGPFGRGAGRHCLPGRLAEPGPALSELSAGSPAESLAARRLCSSRTLRCRSGSEVARRSSRAGGRRLSARSFASTEPGRAPSAPPPLPSPRSELAPCLPSVTVRGGFHLAYPATNSVFHNPRRPSPPGRRPPPGMRPRP